MSIVPKVTVLIPVYNREKYVAAAIDSILAQRFHDFELLLIDDGSTDGSVEIMRSYTRDPRVRLVCNDGNWGIPKTRNKGTTLARGEYLAMLDSDDLACPGGSCAGFASRQPHQGRCAHGCCSRAARSSPQ
jgi:glycosyltransferase involved in cell wall biosynthesis